MFEQIRIVLVHTTHPGNIGAVARAMKNMGLGELWLVAPKVFPCAEASARASGADDLLATARVVDTLSEAVADCGLVIGASARQRALDLVEEMPWVATRQALAESNHHPVAFVFGREHSGLSNAELDLCHMRLWIPVSDDFPSLNLAAAVQVVAYELRKNALWYSNTEQNSREPLPEELASSMDMVRFYDHLEIVLQEIGFLNRNNPRKLMRRLRRLFQRARPDCNEVNILRGILTAVQGMLSGR